MSQKSSFFQTLRRTANPSNSGSNTASSSTPSRHKTAQEQFEEARKASLQWSSSKRGSADVTTEDEEDQNTYASSFSHARGRHQDLHVDPSPGNRFARPPAYSEVPDEIHGPFSPPKDSSPTGSDNTNRFDPAPVGMRRSSGSFSHSVKAVPDLSPKTQDGYPIRGSTPLAPRSHAARSYPYQASDDADPTPPALKPTLKPDHDAPSGSPPTWSDWVQSVTGYAALTRLERVSLLVLLASTPALLWAWDCSVRPSVTPCTTDAVSDAHPAELSASSSSGLASMAYLDVAASALLGVLLSFTLDANTALTDAYIRKLWSAASAAVLPKRKGQKISAQTSAAVRVARLPSAVFARFAVMALLAGYGTKVTVAAVYTTAAGFVSIYARGALLVLVCVAVLYVTLAGLLAYVRYRRARGDVVGVLAAMAKALLLQKERAYPIPYLLEEMEDAVRAAKLSHILSPQPAAATFLGAAGLGSASKARSVEGGSSTSSEREATVREVGETDFLKGFALRQLWSDVQRAVERDSRIQKIDVIVDGKKQPCWRVLTGSTSARI